MQTENHYVTVEILLVTTAILLFFCSSIIYFLFLYQKKRLKHEAEKQEMKDSFAKMLLESKLEIQEQTLHQIGNELHSNIRQIASLIKMNLSMVLEAPESTRENVSETKKLADQLLVELKAITTSLNTDFINKIGFEAALGKELDRLAKGKFETSFSRKGVKFPINPDKGIVLFRLCQEVLNNILEHASAQSIDITLTYQEQDLLLTIADDGKGMNLAEVENNRVAKGSTGLLNMEKRAKLIDGTVTLETTAGKGTSVHMVIPRS